MNNIFLFIIIITFLSCKYTRYCQDIDKATSKRKIFLLDLRYQDIETLPENISQIKIKSIYFRGNNNLNIEKTFEILAQVKNLEMLYLDSMNITNLPANILKLSNLKVLGLRHNKNINIDSCVALLSKLESLEVLLLDYCGISQVPIQISNMSNLTELTLGNNNINSIPSSLFNLKKLRLLSLQANNINTINIEGFNNLKKLKTLFLSENNLNYGEILKFAQLSRRLYILTLGGNNISEREVDTLYKVLHGKAKYLSISGNSKN